MPRVYHPKPPSARPTAPGAPPPPPLANPAVFDDALSTQVPARSRRSRAPRAVQQPVTKLTYQEHRVRLVPASAVFEYRATSTGYALAPLSGANGELAQTILGGHESLCNSVRSGVSVVTSLKPSREGNGLLHQDACALVVAERDAELMGVGIVCTYTPRDGLIGPARFGDAVDRYLDAHAGPTLMLELICALKPTPDGRNANHVATKALLTLIKQYAQSRGTKHVVLKAENSTSLRYFQRHGFSILTQTATPPRAAMVAAPSAITI